MDGLSQVRESSPYLPHSAPAGGLPLNSPCRGATFTISKKTDNIVNAPLFLHTGYLEQSRGVWFDDEQPLSYSFSAHDLQAANMASPSMLTKAGHLRDRNASTLTRDTVREQEQSSKGPRFPSETTMDFGQLAQQHYPVRWPDNFLCAVETDRILQAMGL